MELGKILIKKRKERSRREGGEGGWVGGGRGEWERPAEQGRRSVGCGSKSLSRCWGSRRASNKAGPGG
eukprot:186049-Hanusia_phi.AAC.1